MFARALFAFSGETADIAPDAEAGGVGVVMTALEDAAEVNGGLEQAVFDGVKDFGVEVRRGVGLRVWRVGGGEGDGVVVDARVDEDAALRAAFIVAVGAEGLDIDRTDLDVEALAQDVQLDAASPCVFGLDPSAVVVHVLV